MLNTCSSCGAYRVDKEVDTARDVAICPACGHREPFVRADLLLVGGASGSGKTAVCSRLVGTLAGPILLDADILWSDADADEPHAHFERWLRLAKNLAQSGQRVVLFGAGTGVPANLAACVERRYLRDLHFLALVCDDDVLAARLRARPAWRRSGTDAYVADHVAFNGWLREQGPSAAPPIQLLDTTHATEDVTAAAVAAWIRGRLPAPPTG